VQLLWRRLAGVETTTALESGTTNVPASLSTAERTGAAETGVISTQASLAAIESTPAEPIVRVAPQRDLVIDIEAVDRSIDKQLRAVGRVLNLDES